MNTDKIATQNITSKLNVSVISTTADTQLDQPLWAINWFDLKRGWLYELYNWVVFNHVKKIGAYPIFKGQLSSVLVHNERLKREMLLIVKYPRAQAFLEMIAAKLFQLKSLLRTSSVKHFQFGFTQKINTEDHKPTGLQYKGKLKYLVHVCEGGNQMDIQSLLTFAAKKEVFPYFIGAKSAILGLQKSEKKLKTLDFMLSHVLVFSGFDTESLERFVHTDYYQQFMQSSKNNFIGMYERKI